MPKYRKKPIVVDVIQYLGDENYNEVRQFVGPDQPIHQVGDGKIAIQTLEGIETATPGYWIVRGIKGEYYPVDPDIFAKTYEFVEA